MEQAGQHIFDFLSQWGYLVMLPLMIIEGPVITVISAMLASLGAFNVFVVLILSILGDIIGDVILYSAGYFWGMKFVQKIGRHVGITENLVLKMEKYFIRHGGKTIFAVKSTTGLCWATFTAAGIAKMNFKKFLKNSFLGGIVWSGFLVFMGYFYGYLWREIKQYISWIGYLVFALAALTFVAVAWYKKRQSKKLSINDGEN